MSSNPTTDIQQDKPRYTASYARNALVINDAAAAMDAASLRIALVAVSIASLLIMIISLSQGEISWPIVIVCFVVALVGGSMANNTQRTQLRRLQRAGVFAPATVPDSDLRCAVEVYDDHVSVEGPGSASGSYPYSDLKKLSCDEECIVLRFKGGNYVLIPRKAMSNSRYLECIDFLDEKD